jgi:hypothetical protein
VSPASEKLTAPDESALWVEKVPSTSDTQSIDRLDSDSSGSATVAVKVTDSSSWIRSPDVGEFSDIVGALFWIVTESETVVPVSVPSYGVTVQVTVSPATKRPESVALVPSVELPSLQEYVD